VIKKTATGIETNTAMAVTTAAMEGSPTANPRAKERPLTAFTGLRDASNPALSGVPENSKHKEKTVMTAAAMEITTLFFTS
jgi:hypothetical protein